MEYTGNKHLLVNQISLLSHIHLHRPRTARLPMSREDDDGFHSRIFPRRRRDFPADGAEDGVRGVSCVEDEIWLDMKDISG